MQAVVRVDPHDMDVFVNHWNEKMRKNYRETLSRAKSFGKSQVGWGMMFGLDYNNIGNLKHSE